MRIAIVGGGISGLATAFYLNRFRPEWEIFLFEKEAHLGGKMRTESCDGFLFETGSNGFLSNKPDTLDLVNESGAKHLLLASKDNARIRYIYNGTLHKLPESPKEFFVTKLLSPWGKIRILAELFVPAKKDGQDESLRDFGYRRLGREFTETFLDAMSAGIFASTPQNLSVAAAFPAIVKLEAEYGGLFRGMFKKRKKEAGPGGILMSFEGGVSTFIDHLAKTLNATIFLSTEVSSVSKGPGGYEITYNNSSLLVDKLILSSPAYDSAKLLSNIDPELSRRLETIDYSPISIVGFGYDHLAHPLKGFGLLTTASAKEKILGVLWDSSIFPDRAPMGKKSLRVMIGGQRDPLLALKSKEELIAMAKEGVRRTMGVAEEPQVVFTKQWQRGIPNYGVGHLENVRAIFKRVESIPGLYLNSNAYWGVGLNDCTKSSRECARKVAGVEC